MEGFAFADPVRVKRLIKGNVTGSREELMEETLLNISARLIGWYPDLRSQWEEAEEGSPLRELVRVMVSEYTRKIVGNPEGMSSETMGPYAYSRFDSEDTARNVFGDKDINALEALLMAERRKSAGSITMGMAVKPTYVKSPGHAKKRLRTRWW